VAAAWVREGSGRSRVGGLPSRGGPEVDGMFRIGPGKALLGY
jgi:hypothetical protein